MRTLKSPATAPIALSILLACAAVVGCAQHDDSDPPGGRSGLLIFTDNLTGCQYVARSSLNGAPEALTPRRHPDGTQVCAVAAAKR
jgi:hypothetical protein